MWLNTKGHLGKRRNTVGEITEPCGTPEFTGYKLELIPSITTRIERLHLFVLLLLPKLERIFIKILFNNRGNRYSWPGSTDYYYFTCSYFFLVNGHIKYLSKSLIMGKIMFWFYTTRPMSIFYYNLLWKSCITKYRIVSFIFFLLPDVFIAFLRKLSISLGNIFCLLLVT